MSATLSLAAVLAESARRHGDKIAVVDRDQRIGYADLWHQARAQAAALTGLGVAPGDPVALLVPNVAEFPRGYYAVLAAGGVVVPVHLLLTADEAAYVLRDSGARLLICHVSQLAVGRPAAAPRRHPAGHRRRAAATATRPTSTRSPPPRRRCARTSPGRRRTRR